MTGNSLTQAYYWTACISCAALAAILLVVASAEFSAVEKVNSSDAQTASYELVFSTFLGGSGQDSIRDVATDSAGNVYVTGGTASPNFPTTPGAYDRTFASGGASLGSGGPMDVFVAKLSPSGQLVWSTYLGGPNYDRAYAIEVDVRGFVYVAGRAGDAFPTTPGVVQPQFGGDSRPNRLYGQQDGFIAKLSPNGDRLVWSTYFGGDDASIIRDIALDAAGDVYLVEPDVHKPSRYITPGTFAARLPGGGDVVVAKISSAGTRILYATYLGGSRQDGGGPSIRVDSQGQAYVVGNTRSDDFPTTANAFDRTFNGGNQDLFVAKLTADGSGLVFATYLGGSEMDSVGGTHNLAVDSAGNAYVTGSTRSSDFPTSAEAFQRSFRNQYADHLFVAKLSPHGTQLLASTYVSGFAGEIPQGVSVDESGNVYATAEAYSHDFPVTADAFQRKFGGGRDGVVFKLAADFSRLLYATYLGGTKASRSNEGFRSVAIDKKGNIYPSGWSDSADWPTRNAARPRYAGNTDAVVTGLVRREGG